MTWLQTVMDIKLPANMPLSQRMINKGYSSTNMSEETLLTMDFGYGGRDSPPGEGAGDEKSPRKVVATTRAGNRDDKSRNSTRTTPKLYTAPSLKKHHTVA